MASNVAIRLNSPGRRVLPRLLNRFPIGSAQHCPQISDCLPALLPVLLASDCLGRVVSKLIRLVNLLLEVIQTAKLDDVDSRMNISPV